MDHHQAIEEHDQETEIEIPSYFLCPISMEIMKDPVTISTGITYDRDSIERWVATSSSSSNSPTPTCPVTKQPITGGEDFTTPNHTLRRLIQYWCTLNASHGIERIPTPKPPVSKSHLTKLISRGTQNPIQTLKELRSISVQSLANRRILRQQPGAFDFISSVIVDGNDDAAVDLALSLLHHLHHNQQTITTIVTDNDNHHLLIHTLTRILNRTTTNDESRTFALHLLKLTLESSTPRQLSTLKPEFFTAMVTILTLTDIHYHTSTKTKSQKDALKLLIHTCPWGRNRIAAVEAKAVYALLNILLDHNSHSATRRLAEMAMVVLDQLTDCAEGRADLLSHAAGLAVVSKKILRVSHLATERAVKILSSVAKFAGSNPGVIKQMLEVGVVAKLCLVMQVDFYDGSIKEHARDILRLHAKTWKGHVCVPENLAASYPS